MMTDDHRALVDDDDAHQRHWRLPRGTHRWMPVAIDVLLILGSATYSAVSVYSDTYAGSKLALTMLAAAGLLIRRRMPYLSLALALPGFAWGFAVFAVMFALYSVARYEHRVGRVVIAAIVTFCAAPSWVLMLRTLDFNLSTAQSLITAALFAGLYVIAPVALGIAIRRGAELRQEINRVKILHQERSKHAAEQALERERTVLAREMHDVVSNQVSLIAVQSGALQVASTDPTARTVAETIRSLSVTTLDELRAMIEVLRAAGGADRGPMPQPTLEDLPGLLTGSGITVHTDLHVDRPLPTAIQRAMFRFVQEGLTNARKHAPGADVHLSITTTGSRAAIELVAEPPRHAPLALPSAHHGLIGLRERAELLGGSLTRSLTKDGTHTLRMMLPAATTTDPVPALPPLSTESGPTASAESPPSAAASGQSDPASIDFRGHQR